MTVLEYKAINVLASCTFLPGTFDKRIARQWYDMARKDVLKPMTAKGRAMLWRLVWKYRRQINDSSLMEYAALVSDVPAAQKFLQQKAVEVISDARQESLF